MCEKHKHALTLVCGDLLCAMCFAERMETERIIAKRSEERLAFIHRQFKRKET